jgi:hypothetical protein
MTTKFPTVANFTNVQVRESVEHFDKSVEYDITEWVAKSHRGMKRMKLLVFSVLYHKVNNNGEFISVEEFQDMMVDGGNGTIDMNISKQRLGFFISFLTKKGVLESKKDWRNKVEFRRMV